MMVADEAVVKEVVDAVVVEEVVVVAHSWDDVTTVNVAQYSFDCTNSLYYRNEKNTIN